MNSKVLVIVAGKGFSVEVDHSEDTLRVAQIFGCAPNYNEVCGAVIAYLKKECRFGESRGDVFRRERVKYHPFRFVERTGSSGCRGLFIEEALIDQDFPSRRKMFHISMAGKFNNGLRCRLSDFLDYLATKEELEVCTDVYGRQWYTLYKGSEIGEVRFIDPRDINSEPGWVEPGRIPNLIPSLRERGTVVRKKWSLAFDDEIVEDL